MWSICSAESCFLELPTSSRQDVKNLSFVMKEAFGSSWREALCKKEIVDGDVDPGCPAVLIISSSALRAIELLRFGDFHLVLLA